MNGTGNRRKEDGAEEFRFHYRREERLARHHRDLGTGRPGGILRGNRSLLILLLDLLLVLTLYFGATFFLFPDRDRAELDGWSLQLSGNRVGRDVAGVLLIRRTGPFDPEQDSRLQIEFRAGDASESVREILPERGELTVRITLRGAGENADRVEAEVTIGGRKADLRAVTDD